MLSRHPATIFTLSEGRLVSREDETGIGGRHGPQSSKFLGVDPRATGQRGVSRGGNPLFRQFRKVILHDFTYLLKFLVDKTQTEFYFPQFAKNFKKNYHT